MAAGGVLVTGVGGLVLEDPVVPEPVHPPG